MKITAGDLPNLNSLLRFQKQIYSGNFSRNELEDLFSSSSSTVDVKVAAMHSECADIYGKYRKSVADNAPSRKMHMRNIVCVGIATCPSEMNSWYTCMRGATEDKGAAKCLKFKRFVERCGRETSQKMLRASLDDLFQSRHG
jgi:hypothetical protein